MISNIKSRAARRTRQLGLGCLITAAIVGVGIGRNQAARLLRPFFKGTSFSPVARKAFVDSRGGTSNLQVTFTNSAAINIPNPDTGPNPEPAQLYPSPITVSGLTGSITSVRVKVNGLSHTFPDDLDMLLVGPGGQTFHFWSDVGGGNPVANFTITVADGSVFSDPTLPESAPLGNFSTYRAFNGSTSNDAVSFPAPAPAGPYNEPTSVGAATFASIYGGLSGASLNGVWNLYVTDDADGDSGTISGGWTLEISTTAPSAPPTTAGQLIISEFRLRGPGGANDEFIELYNTTGATLNTQAADGSAGLAVAASDGVARCVVPNGTGIPAGGHFLCANSNGYSLGMYPAGNGTTATGNLTYTTDIPDNAGIAIFNNSTGGAGFSPANRLDAVGSTAEANTTYREGTGYPAIAAAAIDYSFYRNYLPTGVPKDTGNNATDFQFADTAGTPTAAGQHLGAPGPENLSSPVNRNTTIKDSLVDPGCIVAGSPTSACVLARSFTPVTNGPLGTLSIRRKITNNTGAAVTRLRFRIVDLTTLGSPSNTADLRPITSSTFTANLTGGGTTTIQGLTLETPPNQTNGGGYNSTVSASSVTIGTPLAAGASINVHFLFGVARAGASRFLFIVEALP